MRRTLILIAVLVLLACAALVFWPPRRAADPPLTLVLVRHLRVHDTEEKFIVAVTNNMVFALEGYVAQGKQLGGGSTFQLNSHSGTLLEVYGYSQGPWSLGGTYRKAMGHVEVKVRRFLSDHTSLQDRALRAYKSIPTVRVEE